MPIRYVIADRKAGSPSAATDHESRLRAASQSWSRIPTRLPKTKLPEPRTFVPEHSEADGEWTRWDIFRFLLRRSLHLIRIRFTNRNWQVASAQYTVQELDRLGGLWSEFSKILVHQPGWSDDNSRARNERSFVQRKPIPFSFIERQFASDFGRPIADVFLTLDPVPRVADGFFQVFRGQLRENETEVDLWACRPDAGVILKRDASMLRLITLVGNALGARREVFMPRIVWEMQQQLAQVADLRFAAAGMERMRTTLHKQDGHLPAIFLQYSSARLLTVECMDAPSLADWVELNKEDPEAALAWLRQNNIDLLKLGRKLFATFLHQWFEENLIRTDLSPINILLLRDSEFALTPTPRFAQMDSHFCELQAEMFRAMANRDYSKTVDYFLMTCDRIPRLRLNSLRDELVRMFRHYDGRLDLHRAAFSERSYADLSLRLAKTLQDSGVTRNGQTLHTGQAWINLEESLMHLLPSFHVREECRQYFRKRDSRRLTRMRKQGVRKTLSKAVNAVSEQWSFVSSQLRRRSQALNSLNKTAQVFGMMLNGLRTVLLWLLALGILAHQHVFDLIPGYQNSAFGRASERLRFWRIEEIIILGLLGLFVIRVMIRWASQMEEAPEDSSRL